jgi:hypothetical protein
VTVSVIRTTSPSLPSVSSGTVTDWAGDHVALLAVLVIAVAVGLVIVLVVIGDGAKTLLNIVVGLGLIVGAAVLYGYSDRLLDLVKQ